ncbi:MAG TPA: hypothetical protein VEY30_12225, partial [Myxococcaceae bacterium]|nr:hypothetical protein [Myxococcaceae bacterium]
MDYPTHSTVLAEIEHRFGFVPPFFGPAVQTPEVLENLWRQTLTAYVDNPLPDLFKEKVSAYLSRYCAASYCLVCHTCSLRPLGMSGADVLELLRSPALSDPEARTLARKLETEARKGVFPLAESWEEAAVIALSGVLYLAGPIAPVARTALRELLADNDYNRLVTLILYVKTCHGWVESQPSISFTVDDRYKKHFRPLVEEEPGLHR